MNETNNGIGPRDYSALHEDAGILVGLLEDELRFHDEEAAAHLGDATFAVDLARVCGALKDLVKRMVARRIGGAEAEAAQLIEERLAEMREG
jgi:hypothetical protein